MTTMIAPTLPHLPEWVIEANAKACLRFRAMRHITQEDRDRWVWEKTQEDKMIKVMMTIWDEDCKKKMRDPTGRWNDAGDYGDLVPYYLETLLYQEVELSEDNGDFVRGGVDTNFIEYFILEGNTYFEKTMHDYMKLSDWRVSKAFVPLQAVIRSREVRWRQRASKVAVVVQALVRARVVRWRYPLYALIS